MKVKTVGLTGGVDCQDTSLTPSIAKYWVDLFKFTFAPTFIISNEWEIIHLSYPIWKLSLNSYSSRLAPIEEDSELSKKWEMDIGK